MRAFKHVSGPTLDRVLQDRQCTGTKSMSKAAKVMTIVQAHRHEWGWSDAEVARVMVDVLPEYSKPRKSVPQADSENVWADLTSMAEVLSAVEAGGSAAEAGADVQAEAKVSSSAEAALVESLARVQSGDFGAGRTAVVVCAQEAAAGIAAIAVVAVAVVAALGACGRSNSSSSSSSSSSGSGSDSGSVR